MWMQVLVAGGIPVIGKRFPKAWGQGSLKQANVEGFYEDIYRDGIFFATNPHPETGNYLRPEHARGQAVKVFVPGVVRTELAFIEGVIANVRDWREYVASVERLWRLDDLQREEEGRDDPTPMRMPAVLEWFFENYGLLRDQRTREYPLFLQTYDDIVRDPAPFIERAFAGMGEGDVEAAAEAVKPQRRTQSGKTPTDIEPWLARAFDDFYGAVADGNGVSDALWDSLSRVHDRLQPAWASLRIESAKKLVTDGALPPPAMRLAASMS